MNSSERDTIDSCLSMLNWAIAEKTVESKRLNAEDYEDVKRWCEIGRKRVAQAREILARYK